MPLFLRKRNRVIKELMDDPDCDSKALYNTYRQFSIINTLISQWKSIYKSNIRPFAYANNNKCSLLDIGFGGGDIPIKLHRWAYEDGIRIQITAIETDDRAYNFARKREFPTDINFRLNSSTDLVNENVQFNFVISNHLLHHLSEENFRRLLDEAKILSTHEVLFNDIERSDIGYMLFNLLSRPLFRSSFITNDGLASIKRSYTCRELQTKVPDDWKVNRIFPYRLLLSYSHA